MPPPLPATGLFGRRRAILGGPAVHARTMPAERAISGSRDPQSCSSAPFRPGRQGGSRSPGPAPPASPHSSTKERNPHPGRRRFVAPIDDPRLHSGLPDTDAARALVAGHGRPPEGARHCRNPPGGDPARRSDPGFILERRTLWRNDTRRRTPPVHDIPALPLAQPPSSAVRKIHGRLAWRNDTRRRSYGAGDTRQQPCGATT